MCVVLCCVHFLILLHFALRNFVVKRMMHTHTNAILSLSLSLSIPFSLSVCAACVPHMCVVGALSTFFSK